jgi:hypothetical protein
MGNGKDRLDQELEAADHRTLRLAAPLVTVERLEQLVRYQRAWLLALRRLGPGHGGSFAAAQQEALAHAGLSVREQGELEAIVRDFCGKRWSLRTLEERRRHLLSKQARKELSDAEAEKLERLSSELLKLDVMPALERRYGAEAIGLLRAREEELLALHQEIGQALRSGSAPR